METACHFRGLQVINTYFSRHTHHSLFRIKVQLDSVDLAYSWHQCGLMEGCSCECFDGIGISEIPVVCDEMIHSL